MIHEQVLQESLPMSTTVKKHIEEKDIINENKRILEAEKNIKTDKKRQYLNVERDMIQWKEDTRLLEEELEASRRESVMPIASTGINKLKSMWKLFNEECIKEENVHPETM